MGSSQKVVETFLVVYDDTMLVVCWIPGEPILDDLDEVALLFLQDMPVFKFETKDSFSPFSRI
jgi:hypothetical protein